MSFGDPVDLGKVPSIITEDAHIVTALGGGHFYLILHMDSGWLMFAVASWFVNWNADSFICPHVHALLLPPIRTILLQPTPHSAVSLTVLRLCPALVPAAPWLWDSWFLWRLEQIPPGIVLSNSHSITL